MQKGFGVTVRAGGFGWGLAGLLLGSFLVMGTGCSLVVRGILDDEGAPDGGGDAAVDAPPEGGRDGGMPDATPEGGTDGGSSDAGPDGGGGLDGGPADGGPDAEPPVYDSCATIRDVDPAASSGVYTIDPDGPGGADPVEVFCDMDTEGGGWTLCAVATGTPGETASGDWGSPDPAGTGDWYACDRLVGGAGDDFLVVSDGTDGAGVSFGYTDVFLGASLDELTPNTAGDAFLAIFHDRDPGTSDPRPGNAIWGILNNAVPRFGIGGLRNDCVSFRRSHRWSVYSLPTVPGGQGVLQREAMVPYVGYPCGTYGDRGVRMTLWHRPGSAMEPLPRDCAEIQARDPFATSGHYAIDPDGPGGAPPVTVLCDMDTAGGGWTLCAAAVGVAELAVPDWNSDEMDALWPSDWFACDRLMLGDGTEQIRVRSMSDADPLLYDDVFEGVFFNTETWDTMGAVMLLLWHGQTECFEVSPDNRMWSIRSGTVERYGVTAADFLGCSDTGEQGWIVLSRSTVGYYGCATFDQAVPTLAAPCGNYGNYGTRMDMWYRPARPLGGP